MRGQWCDDNLCLGFRKEYSMVNSATGEAKELFPTGKNGEPLSARLPTRELLLGKDTYG